MRRACEKCARSVVQLPGGRSVQSATAYAAIFTAPVLIPAVIHGLRRRGIEWIWSTGGFELATAAFVFLLVRELIWAWDHSRHETMPRLEYWKEVAGTCGWLVVLYAIALLVAMAISS